MNEIQPMLNYFPLAEPRSKQVLALERTMFHATNGIQDIVIAAPTGIGKTTIGAAACLWASQPGLDPKFAPGGFYLSTQKMLQDQLEKDFPRFTLLGDQCASLKSAVEYPCPRYTNCMVGRKVPKSATCDLVERGCCRYIQARVKFGRALLAATNYAYFFTERTYLGALAPRRVLVADECHTLERQLMSFVEFSVDKMALEKWAPGLDVPVLTTVEAFVDWVKKHYLAVVINRMEMLSQRLCENHEDARLHDEFNKLESHVNKVKSSIVNILEHPTDWVYWQQTNGPHRECIARPLFVRNYVKPLVTSAAKLRVYMSAYPGPKKIFCRSLGLDPDKTAWLNLNSTFPPANRPVHILSIGSMGRKNIDQTLPKVLRVTEKLLNLHATEKGIIHCLDAQTRVLTQDGLKYRHEIRESDFLLTRNPVTHAIELQKPNAWLDREHTGTLLTVKNRSLDFAVTDDHLIYAAPGRNGEVYTLLEAKSLIGGRRVFGNKKAHVFKVPRTGIWRGSQKPFEAGPLKGTPAAEFLGWFLSEGCAYETHWKGRVQRVVAIAQTAISTTEIPKLCRSLGLHPYISPSQPDQIRIQNKALWLWLRENCYCGEPFDSFHKSMPSELKQATPNVLRACLSKMVAGDGSLSKNSGSRCGQPHPYYTTVSWKLCQDVTEIAIKSGYSAVFRKVDRRRWKPSQINGRSIDSGEIFVIELGVSGSDARFHESEIKTQTYTGSVFCPVTTNGIILVERNGKCFWTGNCHSYALGTALFNHLKSTEHARRILFARKSSERATCLRTHTESVQPTVLLSPSMSEGFSLDDDLARFQLITKMPYPYLGDQQIAARKDIDPEWYILQTVSTVIQAAGRIVRSDTDHGSTYILDKDFERLFEEYNDFFPHWFQEALVWQR